MARSTKIRVIGYAADGRIYEMFEFGDDARGASGLNRRAVKRWIKMEPGVARVRVEKGKRY